MPDLLERLDSNECLSLAINSAQRDQHGEAISYLKRSIELDPADAKVHYFLGAEYAQIGMMDRAVEAMSQAISLDPTQYTGVFQLGLLHLTSARVDEAVSVWKGLDDLGTEHPLRLFRDGMEALARDDFHTCRVALTQGMALNTSNLALNGDMQKVLDALPDSGATLSGGVGSKEGAVSEEPAVNLFVSAYRTSSTE